MILKNLPNFLSAFALSAISTVAGADEICNAASSKPNETFNPATFICGNVYMDPSNVTKVVALVAHRMQAQIDAQNGTLSATTSLASDMKVAAANLARAVEELAKVSKQISVAQVEWRTKALSDTIAEAKQLPAKLAVDNSLREALIVALRQDLRDDPQFVQAIREALQAK